MKRRRQERSKATVRDVVAAVDRLAPWRLAEAWDSVGLLLGDPDWPARRVLVALDVSEAVCQEAERLRADLVFTHHPLMLKDLDRVTSQTRQGRLALRLAGGRRALVAAHTNLDSAEGGLCDQFARLVGLVDLEPLRAAGQDEHYKVVVFTPESDLEAVRAAAFAAGAGRIGPYSECSFSAPGTGTFRPEEGARPAVGSRGRRSAVPEHRLEVVAEADRLGAVLAAIARAHSYETPAIDVHPLVSVPLGAGLGRIGRLEKPKTLAAFAEKVKRAIRRPTIGVVGLRARRIERVALLTGSGGGLVEAVLQARHRGRPVDCYLTGELKFHEVQDLAAAGVSVVLGGHYETERVPLEAWTPRLAEALPGVQVRLSESEQAVIRTA
jgi:dinuclear metal center YbgI/SA1388 family protein